LAVGKKEIRRQNGASEPSPPIALFLLSANTCLEIIEEKDNPRRKTLN
jgi:hypothetical protein